MGELSSKSANCLEGELVVPRHANVVLLKRVEVGVNGENYVKPIT